MDLSPEFGRELTSDPAEVITVITMNGAKLKVIRVGNSRGVRLPAAVLARYRIGDEVVIELTPKGLLLKPVGDKRLSWEETYRAIAADTKRKGNEFADFESVVADGLEELER